MRWFGDKWVISVAAVSALCSFTRDVSAKIGGISDICGASNLGASVATVVRVLCLRRTVFSVFQKSYPQNGSLGDCTQLGRFTIVNPFGNLSP